MISFADRMYDLKSLLEFIHNYRLDTLEDLREQNQQLKSFIHRHCGGGDVLVNLFDLGKQLEK